MTRASERLRERMLDLAWSLWTGLGVPGQIDNHVDCAVDPEPLIIFTAGLGAADPRLRDEATDWCIRYGQLVAGTRLKNLLSVESEHVRESYGEFAATVATCSSFRWPGATEPRKHALRERPRIQAFNRPSQIVLRLRALLGVGGRADVVRAFLASPDLAFSAADLAAETGYTKRNMAQVLDALRLADIVQAFPNRNQIHYRMPGERVSQLREHLAPLPSVFVRWSPALHVLTAVHEALQQFESKNDNVRGVEARSVVEKLAAGIRLARLPAPRLDVRGPDFWSEFVSWSLAVCDNLVAGNEPAEDRFRAKWVSTLKRRNGEEMERGDIVVWEKSPAKWTFEFKPERQILGTLNKDVHYPTADEAKRSAEVRQFTVDKQKAV